MTRWVSKFTVHICVDLVMRISAFEEGTREGLAEGTYFRRRHIMKGGRYKHDGNVSPFMGRSVRTGVIVDVQSIMIEYRRKVTVLISTTARLASNCRVGLRWNVCCRCLISKPGLVLDYSPKTTLGASQNALVYHF